MWRFIVLISSGSGQQEGLSIINPYMVDKIGFSTGGYAAKYGDKMSSALDITYKTLRAKGKSPIVEGSVAASLLGADAYIGLGTRKLSWLNSVRYKTNAYLLGSMETKGEYKPKYLDYQTYLSYQPNKRWKLDLIGYISDNHYDFEPRKPRNHLRNNGECQEFQSIFRRSREGPLPHLLRNSGHHPQHHYQDQHLAPGQCLLHQGTGEIRHPEAVLATTRPKPLRIWV